MNVGVDEHIDKRRTTPWHTHYCFRYCTLYGLLL